MPACSSKIVIVVASYALLKVCVLFQSYICAVGQGYNSFFYITLGTKTEIDAALVLIRGKFPLKRYPQVTLAQINVAPETTAIQPVLPDSIQVSV